LSQWGESLAEGGQIISKNNEKSSLRKKTLAKTKKKVKKLW